MTFARGSGVLTHPTSFPGPHGVGDLGAEAYRFVDWLVAAKQQYWQIMPLVPVGLGDSPYASPSAFAGNPLLISLSVLRDDGLLSDSDVETAFGFPDNRVDWAHVRAFKHDRLRRAHAAFRGGASQQARDAFAEFTVFETSWLRDHALFSAIKQIERDISWVDWASPLANRDDAALEQFARDNATEVEFHGFVQFLFRQQWRALRAYANERRVKIIGDIPIFVAQDSADVWANRSVFRLDDHGQPSVVAGVPPDYFSSSGQMWGNPLYDWDVLERTGYDWWLRRFSAALELVDIVRIDHFRGFAAAWVVPADAPSAASGRWEQGPGRRLFDVASNTLGGLPVLVEDLGLITDDVVDLRVDLGLPGMAVLQFAFGGESHNAYLPHNHCPELAVYTGTHDNQTTVGWFASIDEATRERVCTYLGNDGSDIAWQFIRLAEGSVADLAIVPMQDVLRLGDDARMNQPGVPSGNWSWRYRSDQLDFGLAEGLGVLTRAFGRDPLGPRPRQFDPFDYTAPDTLHPLG